MDACHFCRASITQHYFRVGSLMACPTCVASERIKESKYKWAHLRRGITFAAFGAIAGWLLKTGVDALLRNFGDSSSIFSLGAFLRGGATLFIGFLVASTAKAGSRKRGGLPLQLSAVTFTYLAYSMAIVPFIFLRIPISRLSALNVMEILFLGLVSPFLAVGQSVFAITGLLVIGYTMHSVWQSTASPIEVTGPFDSTAPNQEKPLFSSLND